MSAIPSPPARWADQPMLALAIATTGLHVTNDRLVAVGVVAVNAARHWERTWLVSPEPDGEIPVEASNIHGISTHRARRDGRPLPQVLTDLDALLRRTAAGGIPLVVFNARFALTVLTQTARRAGVAVALNASPILDPFVLDLHSKPQRQRGNRTLDKLTAIYRVSEGRLGPPARNAAAAARVAIAYAERYPQVGRHDVRALHRLQQTWWSEHAGEVNDRMELWDRVDRQSPHWPLIPVTAAHRPAATT